MARTKMVRLSDARKTPKFVDHSGRPAQSLWISSEASDPSSPDDLVPYWSFQVYTTIDLTENDFTSRWPNELFTDNTPSAWRLDVYERMPDISACIEHQKQERLHRLKPSSRTNSAGGVILENYANRQDYPTLAANGMILVIDHENWFAADGGDHDLQWKGPLVVRFADHQDESDKRIDSITEAAFANDRYEEYEAREQIEFSVERLPQARHPNRDLDRLQTGVYDVEEETKLEEQRAKLFNREADPLGTLEAQGEESKKAEESRQEEEEEENIITKRILVEGHVSSPSGTKHSTKRSSSFTIKAEAQDRANKADFKVLQDHSSLLEYAPVQNGNQVEGISLSYSVNILFDIESATSLETVSRKLLAQLLSVLEEVQIKSIILKVLSSNKDLPSVLLQVDDHIRQDTLTDRSTKDQPDANFMPRYGVVSRGLSSESSPVHEQFIVILDKNEWEDEGVVFGWNERFRESSFTDNTPDPVAARIGGGHGFVLKRLCGLK